MPIGWTDDPASETKAWLPPDGVGRSSLFTIQARQAVTIDEAFARERGHKMATVLKLSDPGKSTEVEQLGPEHLAVAHGGQSRGRWVDATVHGFQPRMIVCAVWHSSGRSDPNRGDGAAATRSVLPLA